MEVSYTAGFMSHPKGKHTIWGKRLYKQMLCCKVKLLKQLENEVGYSFHKYSKASKLMSAHALTSGLTGEKNIIKIIIQQRKVYDGGISPQYCTTLLYFME